jgi:hypothetical protein
VIRNKNFYGSVSLEGRCSSFKKGEKYLVVYLENKFARQMLPYDYENYPMGVDLTSMIKKEKVIFSLSSPDFSWWGQERE